jgi:hypothetical protein
MSLPFVKNFRSVPGLAWKFLMNVHVPAPRVIAEAGGMPLVGESGVRGLVWSARATEARGRTIRTRVRVSRAGDLRMGSVPPFSLLDEESGVLPGPAPGESHYSPN